MPPPVAEVAVVHPGAAFPGRRWPPERFAAVARFLVRAGHDVRITGGPAEEPLARAVAEGAGVGEDAVLAGRATSLELAALVAAAPGGGSGDTRGAPPAPADPRAAGGAVRPGSPGPGGPP